MSDDHPDSIDLQTVFLKLYTCQSADNEGIRISDSELGSQKTEVLMFLEMISERYSNDIIRMIAIIPTIVGRFKTRQVVVLDAAK